MGNSKYEATIDELRTLAKRSMHGAVKDAGHARKKMHALSSGIDRKALSAIASCVHFQEVLSDAIATYAEVVHGIEEDVAAFHHALHQTADTMQHNDESAAAAFTAIANKINGPLATERRGKRAYDKHRSLQAGNVKDAPPIPGVTDLNSAGSGSGGQPSAATAAPPPPGAGTGTSYDARTGNPVPSSSTSAGPPPG
jgi:hypothetical protein